MPEFGPYETPQPLLRDLLWRCWLAVEYQIRQRQATQDALEQANLQLSRRNEELAHANRALACANLALARANEDSQHFAYVASHDLQEPLRKIVGFAGLLAQHFPEALGPQARMYLDRVVESTDRMRRLIRDLLLLSRSGGPTELLPVDSGLALRWAVESLSVPINETGAMVTADVLPTITANETQLEQVFQNLVGNALKYRSEAPPRVHVAAREYDGEWLFTVSDNGVGIDMTQADRIFQVFQRLDPPEERDGTGIGLALCKRIVESYGGRIDVASAPGQGSTFSFTIPATNGFEAVGGVRCEPMMVTAG